MTIRSLLLVGVGTVIFGAFPGSAQVAAEVQADQQRALESSNNEPDQTQYVENGDEVGAVRLTCLPTREGGCAGQATPTQRQLGSRRTPPTPDRTAGMPGRSLADRSTPPREGSSSGGAAMAGQRRPTGAVTAQRRPRPATSPCTTQRTVPLLPLARPVPLEVTFASGSAQITSNARASVESVAAILINEQAAGSVFVISGHTDCVGDDATNLDLSRRRAESVRGLLIELGVSGNSLLAVGFGEERRPVGEAFNSRRLRRVEVARQISAN